MLIIYTISQGQSFYLAELLASLERSGKAFSLSTSLYSSASLYSKLTQACSSDVFRLICFFHQFLDELQGTIFSETRMNLSTAFKRTTFICYESIG